MGTLEKHIFHSSTRHKEAASSGCSVILSSSNTELVLVFMKMISYLHPNVNIIVYGFTFLFHQIAVMHRICGPIRAAAYVQRLNVVLYPLAGCPSEKYLYIWLHEVLIDYNPKHTTTSILIGSPPVHYNITHSYPITSWIANAY